MGVAEKKILIEFERSDNTTENFRFGFRRFLEKIGCDYCFRYIKEIKKSDLEWCDVYIAVRPNSPMSLSIAKAIKKSGRPYIVFFDDDLLYRKDSIKWRNKSSKECLSVSDCVFGANPALCEDYGKYSKNYFSVNTAVDDNELSNPSRSGNSVEFVYAAGMDHASIFEAVIKPCLKELLYEFHDRIHFTFIGVRPRLEDIGYPENFTYLPLMDLDKYAEYMRTHSFDIGLAPLKNDRFSNMKYFNKYIEYSKSAIAGIYSNIMPYTYAVSNDENGFLIDNNPVEWRAVMKECIENIDKVRECGLRAQDDLRSNFSLDQISRELEEKLNEVICDNEVTNVHWSKKRSIELMFMVLDKIGKLDNQIRSRGVTETTRLVLGRIGKK